VSKEMLALVKKSEIMPEKLPGRRVPISCNVTVKVLFNRFSTTFVFWSACPPAHEGWKPTRG